MNQKSNTKPKLDVIVSGVSLNYNSIHFDKLYLINSWTQYEFIIPNFNQFEYIYNINLYL